MKAHGGTSASSQRDSKWLFMAATTSLKHKMSLAGRTGEGGAVLKSDGHASAAPPPPAPFISKASIQDSSQGIIIPGSHFI